MPATITLKNIPDELHQQLKQSAALNRRSLNSEVLIRLEATQHSNVRQSVDETIRSLRAFHATLPSLVLDQHDIDAMKSDGRP